MSANTANEAQSSSISHRERFLRATRREAVDRLPVWFMRQAGRYLPEYQAVRSKGSFMDAVRDPATAAELTCQPVRRFDLDAAVIFCDILVPCQAMGLDVQFLEGKGPVLAPTLRRQEDLGRIEAFDPEAETGFLAEAIRLVRRELGPDRAIIGFCGAPFTTVSYMIEGGSSRNFENTKALLHGQPDVFREMIERMVDALIPYLGMQVEAGADVLQIFDSWGGCLDAHTYEEVLGPGMERLICTAKALDVPVILYINGCSHLLELLPGLGPTVLGIDWRIDPALARRSVGDRCALQGNLDPAALFAPPETVAVLTRRTLAAFGNAPGHIFNLGSGILPGTPVESVAAMVETTRGGSA